MTMKKIVPDIPQSMWNEVSEKLIAIILKSKNAKKMPSHLAKTILHFWHNDQMGTEIGLQWLLEASILLEPEKTTDLMKEIGLSETLLETLRE